jgi:hypothetical protein
MPREAMVVSHSYLCAALVLLPEDDGALSPAQICKLNPVRPNDPNVRVRWADAECPVHPERGVAVAQARGATRIALDPADRGPSLVGASH